MEQGTPVIESQESRWSEEWKTKHPVLYSVVKDISSFALVPLIVVLYSELAPLTLWNLGFGNVNFYHFYSLKLQTTKCFFFVKISFLLK